MLQSVIDDTIEYIEDKDIDEYDRGKEVSLFEIEIFGIKMILALGMIKNDFKSKNILYVPVYVIISKDVVEKIGYYEFYNSSISEILDSDGDLDVSMMEGPLLFEYVDSDYLFNLLKKSAFLKEFTLEEEAFLNELAGEDSKNTLGDGGKGGEEKGGQGTGGEEKGGEEKGDDEDGVVDNVEQIDNIDKVITEHDGSFNPKIFQKVRAMYKKALKSSVVTSSSNWLQKHFKNKNFNMVDNEGDGDCFFSTLRDAFKSIKVNVSVVSLRNILSNLMTENNFKTYKEQYDLFELEIQKLLEEESALSVRKKKLKQTYDKFKLDVSEIKKRNDRDEIKRAAKLKKNIKTENAYIKKRTSELVVEKKNAMTNIKEFNFMKNIKTMDEFKDIVKTNRYWADSMAIAYLEEAFNIKIIVVSQDSYSRGDYANLITCGDMVLDKITTRSYYKPKYYVIVVHTGNHYKLLTYKDKRIFSFYEVPYGILSQIKDICGKHITESSEKKTLYEYIPMFNTYLRAGN
jgi:hypothetical protein